MNRIVPRVACLGVGVVALVSPLACSDADDPPSGASGAAGTPSQGGSAGLGGKDGNGGSVTSGPWNTVDPATLPSCGLACRTLTGPLRHPGHYGFFYGLSGVTTVLSYESVTNNIPVGGLLYARGPSSDGVARKFPAPSGFGWTSPSISAENISVVRTGLTTGSVDVINRVTGVATVITKYDQKKDHPEAPIDYGISATGLNDKYVFWHREGEGWYKHNLALGETKLLTTGISGCDGLYTAQDGILCGSTNGFKAVFVDQESGEITKLSPEGTSIQEDTAVSPDGNLVVWIDYRDFPGTTSTDTSRSGGEVYVHNRATKETKRLTFDSPSAPRGKTTPAIGKGDVVTWLETCKTCDPNPGISDQLYNLATTLVRLEVASGKKCRLHADGQFRRGGRSTLFDHEWYHYVKVPNDPMPYLGALNLDDPALPWECE